MTFAERHARINEDPLVELMRRRQLWASCPGPDGAPLAPAAYIIPEITVLEAITELIERRLEAKVPGAMALYEKFYDL